MKRPAGRNPPYATEISGRNSIVWRWILVFGSSSSGLVFGSIMRDWTSWSPADTMARMLIPRTNPPSATEKIVDGWLTSIEVPKNGMIVSMQGLYGSTTPLTTLVQVSGTTWTPKTSSMADGFWLVSPFWMTEYMMNSRGIWRISGRQPASGLTPRSFISSCWATRDLTASPL